MILISLSYLPQQLSQFLYHRTSLLLCIMAETDDNPDISNFSVGTSHKNSICYVQFYLVVYLILKDFFTIPCEDNKTFLIMLNNTTHRIKLSTTHCLAPQSLY